MSSYALPDVLHAMVFLSDSIFTGLKIFVPVLFALQLFRSHRLSVNFDSAIIASNTLILSSGFFFLCSIISNTTMAWTSGNESERNLIISFVTGPHWYQFIIPVFNYGILPNFMWFKKFRKSIALSFSIVSWWLLSSYVISSLDKNNSKTHIYLSEKFPFEEYAWKLAIFLVLFLIVYRFVLRKQKQMVPVRTAAIEQSDAE
jgi:hypothetical protein